MNAQLILALQPIVSASKNRYVGHEVLSRFLTPSVVSPPHLHVKHGEWAKLDSEVSRLVLEWMISTHPHLKLPVFVNLSGQTLGDADLFGEWLERLSCIDASIRERLVIEVSEATVRPALDRHWDALKQAGVKIAIDDYGKENSGFQRLVDFPWDYCKFHGPAMDKALMESALEHCRITGKRTIMECIETSEASTAALHQGCDYQQGFFFSRPRLLDISILILSHKEAPFFIKDRHSQIGRSAREGEFDAYSA